MLMMMMMICSDGDDDGFPEYSHQSKSHHGEILSVVIKVGNLSPVDYHH